MAAPDGSFSLMTERSDGLRSFVALRAFLGQHNTDQPPVLMVAEAEIHIHYDAQANFVDMFTNLLPLRPAFQQAGRATPRGVGPVRLPPLATLGSSDLTP